MSSPFNQSTTAFHAEITEVMQHDVGSHSESPQSVTPTAAQVHGCRGGLRGHWGWLPTEGAAVWVPSEAKSPSTAFVATCVCSFLL